MKFCTNCGKELDDHAAFCTGCGTAVGVSPGGTVQSGGEGVYTQTTPNSSGSYTQNAASGYQGGAYQQNAPQSNQSGPYSQNSAPGYPGNPYQQAGAPNYQGAPYQNSPYGNPSIYPGGRSGSNKTLIIVIAAIVAVALIGVGIFAYIKLSGKNNTSSLSNNNPSSSSTPSSKPTDNNGEDDNDVSDILSILDSNAQDNVLAACEEIGLDYKKIKNFESYSEGDEGTVYTFTYKGSVVDLFLYENGTVFSIETGGTQVYLDGGYEPFSIDDYLGSTTHYDKSSPDNGYVFYKTPQDVDSEITINTSSDLHYAIELINVNDNELTIAFYAQAGGLCYMAVPAGDYYVRYATGTTWQNADELFGPETLYYAANDIYSVNSDNAPTITLDVYGGTGIPSTQITGDEF